MRFAAAATAANYRAPPPPSFIATTDTKIRIIQQIGCPPPPRGRDLRGPPWGRPQFPPITLFYSASFLNQLLIIFFAFVYPRQRYLNNRSPAHGEPAGGGAPSKSFFFAVYACQILFFAFVNYYYTKSPETAFSPH